MSKFLYYHIATIFILSFFKGFFYIIGVNTINLQLFIEFLIIIFFSVSLLYVIKNQKIIFYAYISVYLLFLVIAISFFFNQTSTIQLLLFFRVFFIYYLFFFALLNINLPNKYKDKLVKLIIILFLIQVPAAFIKLAIIGTEEFFIGTMAYLGGDIATIMPLMATSYLIANYLVFKRNIYIVFIFLFIAIALISNKLGILFYVAILFVFLSFLYSSQSTKFIINTIFLKKMLALLLIFSLIFIAYVKLNPRANPEHKVGGSVNVEYLLEYTEQYNTAKIDVNVDGDGRFDAPFVALERLYDGGIFNVLFGYGPGDIVKSSYNAYGNPLLEKYYIGYGGRLGVVWTLMQIGVVGTFIFVLFHVWLFKKLMFNFFKKKYNKKNYILLLTVLGFSLIYMLDFFTYAMVLIKVPGLVMTYYFMIYYVMTAKDIQKRKI